MAYAFLANENLAEMFQLCNFAVDLERVSGGIRLVHPSSVRELGRLQLGTVAAAADTVSIPHIPEEIRL